MSGYDRIRLSTEDYEDLLKWLKRTHRGMINCRRQLDSVYDQLDRESGSQVYVSGCRQLSFGMSASSGKLKRVLYDYKRVMAGCALEIDDIEDAVRKVCDLLENSEKLLIKDANGLEYQGSNVINEEKGFDSSSKEDELRKKANSHSNMSKAVDTSVFNWKNVDKMVFLNAPGGASGAGHSAVLMIDNEGKALFLSYFPEEAGAFENGEMRMKYLSKEDTENFFQTGEIENAVTSTSQDKIVTDGGYERGIIKSIDAKTGEKIYNDARRLCADPGDYNLFSHQCDDVATDLFFTSGIEEAAIEGVPGMADITNGMFIPGTDPISMILKIANKMGDGRNILPNNTYNAMETLSGALNYEVCTIGNTKKA